VCARKKKRNCIIFFNFFYCYLGTAETASLLAVSVTKGDSLTGLEPGNEIGLE
jgi:hypothetical protein